MHTIRVNHKTYVVDPHAARRMLERGIPEEWVVETLQNGSVRTQSHGRDRYEHQIYDDIIEAMILVTVVVDEADRIIITVIDETHSKDT